MTRILLLVTALTAACATAPSPDAEQKPTIAASAEKVNAATSTVEYFQGTMQATSPDGQTAFGPPQPALVKRELFPTEGRIIETTLDEGSMRVTTLTQKIGNTFTATDSEGSFTGKIMFSPDPWAPVSWSYQLTMADGSGKIIGEAAVTPTSIKTSKFFVTPDNKQAVHIVDDLTAITAEEYEAALPK